MLARIQRFFHDLTSESPVPAYVLVRPEHARRCPECGSGYAARDRYCPGCTVTVPEWRFG